MRGVRVLEIAGSVAGAFCGRMFATTGADVVVAEPGQGTPTRRREPFVTDAAGAPRSTMHEYLDAGKRSIVVDLEGADGDSALAWADIVIVSVDGDPDTAVALRERLRRLSPSTSLVAISGFGLTGPYRRWHTSDLVDWASGGYLYVSGEPGRAPLQGAGPWASLLTGATAAVGGAVAFLDATRTGVGQLVDVGNMEAIAAGHQWSITMYTHTGVLKERAGVRFENYHPISIYECSDGWIMIAAPMPERFEDVCVVCEAWDLLLDESLATPGVRFERADEIDVHLRPWLLAHTVDEAVTALQERRVPTAKLNNYLEVLDAEQLRLRDKWATRPDLGPAARMPDGAFRLEPGATPHSGEPTHALGSDTDAFLHAASAEARPPRPVLDLAAVRVAEFSIAWAGPLAGRFLADFGVDVVKVEHPGSRGVPSAARDRLIGAPGWTWGTPAAPQIRAEIFPNADPQQRFWNRSGIWNKMNRGKRSLALEAKVPAGKEILDRLLGDVDVVLNNYSPRGSASLGVNATGVAPLNPDAVTVSMTGYGETGPMAPHFSLGPILEAFGGLDEAMGYMDEGPQRLGIAYPDAVGGVHGAFATLAALWERACTGSAVHVDLSQLETLLAIVGHDLLAASLTGAIPPRRGNRSLDDAPQGVYRCAGDDRWVAITITGDEQWDRFVEIVGGPLDDRRGLGLDARRADHDAIDESISAWTATRADRDVAACLQAAGIAACPAFTTRDLVEDPHLDARGFIVEWDQVDVGPARFPGYPIHFEQRGYEVRGAPALGADNAAVLRRLGYDDDEIARLEALDVVADHPPS